MATISPNNKEVTVQEIKTTNENPFMKLNFSTRILVIVATVLISVVLILLVLPKPKPPTLTLPSPQPTSTSSATLIPRQTSEFSKTEEFTAFERNLNSLRTDAEKLELTETKLSYPFLDMQLNFGE